MTQPDESVSAPGEKAGVYAGSFDPVTKAHIDIIFQAAQVLSGLIVVVGVNSEKNPWFTDEERIEMLRHEIETVVKPRLAAEGKSCDITVEYNSGLTAAWADWAGDFPTPRYGDFAIFKVQPDSDDPDAVYAGLFDESWKLQ